ncbi:heme-binding protein [Novosphingobium colocasiae]
MFDSGRCISGRFFFGAAMGRWTMVKVFRNWLRFRGPTLLRHPRQGRRIGWRVPVRIVDAATDALGLPRLDGVSAFSETIAQSKTVTAALTRASTAMLQ